jgi:hypothetical protein
MISPTHTVWADLTESQRVEKVASGVHAGLRGEALASFCGTTRSAVAGIVHRMRQAGDRRAPAPRPVGRRLRQGERSPEQRKMTKDLRSVNGSRPRIAGKHYRATIPAVPMPAIPDDKFSPLAGCDPVTFEATVDLKVCQWAVDGTMGPSKFFCGAPRDGERRFCPAHYRLAYTPVPTRRDVHERY